MARQCKVCTHPNLEEINKSLIESKNISDIAREFNLPWNSVSRHKDLHLPKAMTEAQEAEEIAQADTLLEQVERLNNKAWELLNKAENAGHLKTALQGVREAKSCLELLAKLEGELQQEGTVNINQVIIPTLLDVISREVDDPVKLRNISTKLKEVSGNGR